MIFMNDNLYLSQNEINKIESLDLDKNIINARKNNDAKLFIKIQIKNSLNKLQTTLADNEVIDFYASGRNYLVDSRRLELASSLFFSECAHPIYGWNTTCLLVKTNKRFILIELNAGFEYSKHYDISNEFHLVSKKDVFYLIVCGDGKKTIIEFNNSSYNAIMDTIRNTAHIVIDEEIDKKLLKIGFPLISLTKLIIIILIIDLILVLMHYVFGIDLY